MFRLIQESPQGFDFAGLQCLQHAVDGETGRGVAARGATIVGLRVAVGRGVAVRGATVVGIRVAVGRGVDVATMIGVLRSGVGDGAIVGGRRVGMMVGLSAVR